MCDCKEKSSSFTSYNPEEMNRQAYISYPVVKRPYFYATKQGGGQGIEFEAASNFDDSNLEDSLLHSMGKFSSADGEEEREYEDEDNTEYENEEYEYEQGGGGDIPTEELPKFRQLVRDKKLELKAQYGKAKISVFECGIKPLNPDLAHPNVPCLWDCSKSRNYNKDCCAKNRQQAQKRAEQRDKIAAWEKCRSENKGIIVWGWRKRWRDFKKQGGLAQLRMQAKGLTPPKNVSQETVSNQPTPVSSPKPKIPVINKPFVINDKNKPKLLKEGVNKFDKNKKNEVVSSKEKNSDSSLNNELDEKKFLGMPKKVGVAVAILGTAAVIFSGYKLYVKFKK